jgi:hypothetical protein
MGQRFLLGISVTAHASHDRNSTPVENQRPCGR